MSSGVLSQMCEYYADLEAKIAAEGRLGGFTTHNTDKGSNREQILIDILNAHLPRRLKAIKGGVVVNLNGDVSKQIDIIIVHDAFPAFGAVANPVVIAEAVLGVIEVKSSLTISDTEKSRGELLKAIDNVTSVPTMTGGSLVAKPKARHEIFKKLPVRAVYAYTCGDQRALHAKAQELLLKTAPQLRFRFPNVIAVNQKVHMVHHPNYKHPARAKVDCIDLTVNKALQGLPIGAILSMLVDTVSFLPHMEVNMGEYVAKAFGTVGEITK